MNIAVAVPTIQLHRANGVLGMLGAGTLLPNKVWVMSNNIDISQCLQTTRKINKQVKVWVTEEVEGVNPKWNEAIREAVLHNMD